jgi:hypothetical protein
MPEIFTGSNKSGGFETFIKQLKDEEYEALRAKAGNSAFAASMQIDMRNPETAKEILIERLGAPEDMVNELVDSAMNHVPGMVLRFRTEFLKPEGTVWPRRYTDFSLYQELPQKSKT